jgi:hypothetical protein
VARVEIERRCADDDIVGVGALQDHQTARAQDTDRLVDQLDHRLEILEMLDYVETRNGGE